MKIAIQDRAADVDVIRELLSPWDVSFTCLDDAEVVIVRKGKPPEEKKTIAIPSLSADLTWTRDAKLHVLRKQGKQVFVHPNSELVLAITPETLYSCNTLCKPSLKDDPSLVHELDKNLVFLTLDVVAEYARILDKTLNSNSSFVYRLLTGLPIPYSVAPKTLRDWLMRESLEQQKLSLLDKLPLDALRFILVAAIEKLSHTKLERKKWNGRRYACIITHDIDTVDGLRRAREVKKLEEKYDLPSAWYIPSEHYRLDGEIIQGLANHGEVGAHDTKHDGRLVRLSDRKLVARLRDSKRALEEIISCSVDGFRAPLLQHSFAVLQGLKEAGYKYDSSIPTWEPKHPRTRSSHGLGTVYPIFLDGLTEIPVSAVQDHQLLYVLGLKPKRVVAEWLSTLVLIKKLGGCCVFLSHPEYELLVESNLALYEELLNSVASDDEAWIATPKQLTRAEERTS